MAAAHPGVGDQPRRRSREIQFEFVGCTAVPEEPPVRPSEADGLPRVANLKWEDDLKFEDDAKVRAAARLKGEEEDHEASRREAAERRRMEEEEAAKRKRKQEEEDAKREEDDAERKRRQAEEDVERRRRLLEEEDLKRKRKQEEEDAKRELEDAERKRRQAEEDAERRRRLEEEDAERTARRNQEEEEAKRRRREEEEARRRKLHLLRQFEVASGGGFTPKSGARRHLRALESAVQSNLAHTPRPLAKTECREKGCPRSRSPLAPAGMLQVPHKRPTRSTSPSLSAPSPSPSSKGTAASARSPPPPPPTLRRSGSSSALHTPVVGCGRFELFDEAPAARVRTSVSLPRPCTATLVERLPLPRSPSASALLKDSGRKSVAAMLPKRPSSSGGHRPSSGGLNSELPPISRVASGSKRIVRRRSIG
eukprot:gnl/TRDRNA2_/TRDRNA2_47243_c0_seq2.p1 gnl/TRDRNA2_/TRDRNA2_47243_c0~~gnl/TRDRNA2_/TRDRNA2_47243_c0_seq2.p1  ORF type:complete len:424 (-),score=101.24 gnl/TRDRNA2_/TRDRNA2_47243_c0_seq2:70-1341(-)